MFKQNETMNSVIDRIRDDNTESIMDDPNNRSMMNKSNYID